MQIFSSSQTSAVDVPEADASTVEVELVGDAPMDGVQTIGGVKVAGATMVDDVPSLPFATHVKRITPSLMDDLAAEASGNEACRALLARRESQGSPGPVRVPCRTG